jgi:hypothetical protein
MQEIQQNGLSLSINLINWDSEQVKNLFSSLLPNGPLFEGYHKNDTIKGCLAKAIAEMILLFLKEHNNTMKQLNWLNSDTLLPSWEKLCSLNAGNLTIDERRLNVGTRMGLTRTITSIDDLSKFIRYLGLDFISVKHLSKVSGKKSYNYTYDRVYYGDTSLRYGVMWELYADKTENNEKIKKVLKALSIQTARHHFTEIA